MGSFRSRRAVGVGVAALIGAAAAVPAGAAMAGAAVPAERVSPGRCVVEAQTPRETPRRGNVAYSFNLRCPRGWSALVLQRTYEQDRGRDQAVGGPYRYEHRWTNNRVWRETTRERTPNTERGAEEVYHVLRWKEANPRGGESRWFTTRSDVATVGR